MLIPQNSFQGHPYGSFDTHMAQVQDGKHVRDKRAKCD